MKTLVSVRSVGAALKDLRSVMSDKASPPTLLLEKVRNADGPRTSGERTVR